MRMNELFNGQNIHNYLKNIESKIEKELINPTIKELSVNEIRTLIEQKYNLYTPVLLEDEIYEVRPEEVDLPLENVAEKEQPEFNGSGWRYTFYIPFRGDGRMFSYQPSSYKRYDSTGEVEFNKIRFTYHICEDDQPDLVYKKFEQDLEKVRQPLFHLSMAIETFIHKMINRIKFEYPSGKLQKAV